MSIGIDKSFNDPIFRDVGYDIQTEEEVEKAKYRMWLDEELQLQDAYNQKLILDHLQKKLFK